MSEGQFQYLFTQVPMPTAVLDSDLRFVQVNRWISQLHGIPAEAFVGKTVAELLPGLAPRIQRIVERVLITKETAQIEMNGHLLSQGEPGRYWLISYVPLPEGSEVLMLAVETTERKKLQEALKRANTELTVKTAALQQADMLDEMCRLLRTTIADVEAYWIIESYMRQLFPLDAGALCIVDADKNVAEVVATWGEQPVCESVFNPDHCRALQKRRAYEVEDLRSGGACRHIVGGSGSVGICLPVQANLQMLGILHLRKATRKSFEESQLALASKVADETALALANLKLQRSFRHQAQRDALTGLYNRRYLEDSLHRELRRSIRKNLSLGVMMVDIDHFKQFNDSEGHAGGDALLRRLGEWIPSLVRAEDIICRYGGDEFLLVLPDTSLENLMKRGEELRQAIKQFTLQWQGKTLNVTASIGAAVFPDHGSSFDGLMKAADDALYSAKANGRDRVEVAVGSHQKDMQRLRQLLSTDQDLLRCKQAGKVLAGLSTFASRICTQGYSNAVEKLLPEHHQVASPAEIVIALASSLTPNMSGLDGDLLHKALEETILEAAGLGYELRSLEIVSGLQNFVVRRGVTDFLELFLSLYVFDVVVFKMQDQARLAAQAEASIMMSLHALERHCREVVRSVSADLRINTRVKELRRNRPLAEMIMRTIEERLRSEGESEEFGRPPEEPKSPKNARQSLYSAKRINRIS